MTNKKSGRHTFSFDGGEKLTTIGASFFVSYLYHQYVDSNHNNWASIKTQKSRISTISRTENFHKSWLNHIKSMNDANLNKNTLGLDGVTIKEMAKAIDRSL
ncbi:hypothetical protein [Thiomicrorhabdus sp.]|uniref:hypothetical protein n=1 Tax=Thiomicrorhabdus sp. TaxID=2039724 RepID=UPI002AA82C19|nr:hypothetical protein [Thiomicrorhabdus sp.]